MIYQPGFSYQSVIWAPNREVCNENPLCSGGDVLFERCRESSELLKGGIKKYDVDSKYDTIFCKGVVISYEIENVLLRFQAARRKQFFLSSQRPWSIALEVLSLQIKRALYGIIEVVERHQQISIPMERMECSSWWCGWGVGHIQLTVCRSRTL